MDNNFPAHNFRDSDFYESYDQPLYVELLEEANELVSEVLTLLHDDGLSNKTRVKATIELIDDWSKSNL